MTPRTTYADLIEAQLAVQTPESLDALRAAVRTAPGFDPDLAVSGRAATLLRAGDHAGAVSVLEASMPGALFSPAAHAMLATALGRVGRPDEAARHARLARAALDSILSTGDGTRERPWSVLRVSDEHDVVDSLGTRPVEQALVREDDRSLDSITCQDGREVWFDVTGVPRAVLRG